MNWTSWITLLIIFVAVPLSIVSCVNQVQRCEAAGGHVVYEYKQHPSCWSDDGRRMFP